MAGQALGVVFVAEDLVLPEGVVGVLDRQRRPAGCLPFSAGRVGGGEIVGEGAEGPAVAGDVVHEQQQDVLGPGEA